MTGGLRKLNEDVYAAGQISPADIPALSEAGIKSILNNRPNGEVFGQPSSEDMRIAAEAFGLQYAYVPMAGGALSEQLVKEAAEAFRALPKPILAHCAGGMRSAVLWAFSNAKTDGVDAVIAAAGAAGFALEQFRPMLTRHAQS
ncbi:TIGR01244 family sulfur transferase [Robiginitomaculum antarcticum]|uniref:TIGR01244 family sulfur transferase n=1 Tax=Robiginitomaculum antarcticum TaxID=437507 RepID=UPI0003637430|nr:TIGR01244 family sulfur transferase [Robiginitomaculum antarcticum]